MLLARVYNPLVQQNTPVPNFCWSNQPTVVRALPLSWPLANLRGHTVRQWAMIKPVLWACSWKSPLQVWFPGKARIMCTFLRAGHIPVAHLDSWMPSCLEIATPCTYRVSISNQLAPKFCWELALQDVSRLWLLVLSNPLLDTVNRKKLLVLSLPLQWSTFVFCGVFFIAQVSGFCSLN